MLDWFANWQRSRRPASDRALKLLFTLHQGNRYSATIQLKWPSESWAPNSKVEAKFRDIGFKDVKVTGSGSKRRGKGTWDRSDVTAELDPRITDVKEET